MVYLARKPAGATVLISDIAAEECLPKKFLDVILLDLKNHGFLISKKGKGGGYMLALSAEQITVGNIVRALDGPLAPVPCVSRSAYQRCADCPDEQRCAVRAVMGKVRDALAAILDHTSLADMARMAGPGTYIPMYDI